MFWFKKIHGREGEVVIPALGAVIGTTREWSLVRSEDNEAAGPFPFIFRASFSYLNERLWKEDGLTKEVRVTISRGKKYRVEQAPGKRTALEGMALYMEACTIWPVEQS